MQLSFLSRGIHLLSKVEWVAAWLFVCNRPRELILQVFVFVSYHPFFEQPVMFYLCRVRIANELVIVLAEIAKTYD